MAIDFQQPVQPELLWVYEGLTRYLDVVLTGRSGLRTPDEVRDYMAWQAGYLDKTRPGRTWRSLHDASMSAQLLYPASDEWTALATGMDGYLRRRSADLAGGGCDNPGDERRAAFAG